MKKILIIASSVVFAAVAFVGALVLYAHLTGGIPPGSRLAGLPVVKAFVKTRTVEAEDAAQATAEDVEQKPPPRSISFLRFGTRRELEQLVDELEQKNLEYDSKLAKIERRARELDAWERQLRKERENLTARFDKERDELARLRREISQEKEALETRQVALRQAEEGNLKKTAKVYASMDPQKAASLLGQLYEAEGQKQTAVKIVYLMDDRSAGKLLSALSDPAVGAEITEKLTEVTPEAQEGQ